MPLEYVNRCGDRYYALQGTTKTGKPKYYAARKPKGIALDQMPDGFEFYEHPEQGIVTIRKVVPSQITEDERSFLEEQTRLLAGVECFIVSIQGDSLVVYTPSNEPTTTADRRRRSRADASGPDADDVRRATPAGDAREIGDTGRIQASGGTGTWREVVTISLSVSKSSSGFTPRATLRCW